MRCKKVCAASLIQPDSDEWEGESGASGRGRKTGSPASMEWAWGGCVVGVWCVGVDGCSAHVDRDVTLLDAGREQDHLPGQQQVLRPPRVARGTGSVDVVASW